MNPFNLPPPWNAGYATPANVADEGLERRGIVTEWAPRGSFDNPSVGTAGYAVPKYITEEPYGQGAQVTRQAPRGTYYGPRIPQWIQAKTSRIVSTARLPGGATKMQIETLAGIEQKKTGSAPVTTYARTAASALIDTVRMMPPDIRNEQLRAILNEIEPGLYARAEEMAKVEEKAGVVPLVALERGIAAAMSIGLAKELVELGRTRQIKQRTQLGAMVHLGDMKQGGAQRLFQAVGEMFFRIGPFLIPKAGKGTWTGSKLSPEQWGWLRDCGNQTHQAYKEAGWKNFNLRDVLNKGVFPLCKFVMPDGSPNAGKEYALYTKGKFYEQKEFTIELRPYEEPKETTKRSWWRRAWGAIRKVVAAIVNVVKDAVKWVANQGCKLLSNPDIAQAVGASAKITIGGTVGAQVGAIGGQIAAEACSKGGSSGQDQTDVSDEKKSGIMPLLLLGGAGAAAYFLYGRSK